MYITINYLNLELYHGNLLALIYYWVWWLLFKSIEWISVSF